MQEAHLSEKVREAEREQMILSHALADRDAQLQLQETKTKVRHGTHNVCSEPVLFTRHWRRSWRRRG